MSDATTPIIYLEADDEVTSVVRRLRAAEPGPVIIVAPGRSRATSSVVALRLVARAAEAVGREVSVVGDALTRSLATEAGLQAFGSLEDARRADGAIPASEPRHAEIHVVRGSATEEGAPTLAALPLDAARTAAADDVTRPVPVQRPTPAARASTATARGPRVPRLPIALAGAVALLVVGALVVGAVLLPAATITIAPHHEALDPVTDVIVVEDPERLAGTVEATATVAATGSYEVDEAAIGTVVFFNFNFFDVEVPAGSLVATGTEEGDQAYATDAAVVVPAGEFDPIFGGITAGEAAATVTAAATGEAGNVAEGAIDTVLDRGLAGQLRGFPSITEPLVTNPDATAGGLVATGVEITQDDVDAAVADLRAALVEEVRAALGSSDDAPHVDPDEPSALEITGLDGLAGTRDEERVEIGGRMTYERLVADAAAVESEAIARFSSDPTSLPDGWQLVEGMTTVEIGEVRRSGDGLAIEVTVVGGAAPRIEPADVVARSAGRGREAAVAALASLGTATVDLWPGWVTTVPDSAWRVEVRIVEPEALGP